MRRVLLWLPWGVGLVAALPACLLGIVLLAANTPAGRDLLESSVRRLSAGMVSLQGLSGRLPDDFGVARVEIADDAGVWLTIEQPALTWSPGDLLLGKVRVDRLAVERVAVARLPASEPEPAGEKTSLPLALDLRSLQLGRLELAPEVAGPFARAMTIQGALRLVSLQQGNFDVAVRELGGEGRYSLRGDLDPSSLQAEVSIREPDRGVIASAAGFTGLGPLTVEATVSGPRSQLRTALDLGAGDLKLALKGALDLVNEACDLTVEASAPAMQPRPDLSWQAVTLNGRVRGPFSRVQTEGALAIEALRSGEAGVASAKLDWHGNAGQLHAEGRLEGLRVPGPRPELLETAPLELKAGATLDAADRPVTFTLRHPLLAAEGTFKTAPGMAGEVNLRLPDLAPLAELGGLKAGGHAEFRLRAETREDGGTLEADGRISVTAGEGVLPALVGDGASLALSVSQEGEAIALPRLQFRGKALQLTAAGRISGRDLELQWDCDLADVRALTPDVSGQLSTHGRLKGPSDAFALTAEASGEIAVQALPKGPVTVKLEGEGLPRAPKASVKAEGVLAGSPLQLAVRVQGDAGGAFRVDVDRIDWKSAHGAGSVVLPKGAIMPLGDLDLRMARLSDLSALLGQPLSGSVEASLSTAEPGGRPQALLQMDARDLNLGEVAGEHWRVDLTVADPAGRPWLDGRTTLTGVAARGLAGDLRLDVEGPKEGLNLRLSGDIRELAGSGLRWRTDAQLDIGRSELTVSGLQVDWKNENLHLLEPLRVGFAEGIVLERLGLGLREAELEARGRITPALDLTLSLRRLPASLAALFSPGLALDGTLGGRARLSGPASRVTGDVEVEAEGLRFRGGAGHGLPPAHLQASAQLTGNAARIDGRAGAGPNLSLTVAGEVPMTPSGLFDLRGVGTLDLKWVDPLLAIGGRRARGRLNLDAGVGGTRAEPRIRGQVQLERGEWQDYIQGIHLADLTGLLQGDGDTVRLVRLQGRAGQGTVLARGSVAPLAPGVPIDLSFSARKAGLLSRERLTVNLDADVALNGQLRGSLLASGKVRINRAEIRIPERMPTGIAVLDVREAGAPPPPPPASGPDIGLNLTLDAPREIFVRGRGLDAELGGTVRVQGTAGNPLPDGHFAMRRGRFAIAGQTLNFRKGVVGFDGGRLTDPSLDFLAQTTSGTVTANLAVTGTASQPKITLSSVPELPQDEVLAQLLFGRGSSGLSAFEMVQIAAAVASLTGITGGGDPLEGVRTGLGLDRLSVGGGATGPTLEAGRYVAPGVYVGARQGAALNATQGTVQIDVIRGLKLEASMGTGTGTASATGANAATNSVGVIYQFEY